MKARFWTIGILVLGLVGCVHQQTRLQSDDEDRDKEANVKTIGEVAGAANLAPVHVSGVSLVVGLDGTGGGAPPGEWRTMLEDHLRKRGVENVKEILSSKDTALVLVSGSIPAGTRKGHTIDLEVTLPPHSKTSSLRGGYLKECLLYEYDSTKGLSPGYKGGDYLVRGDAVVKAEGPLIVGFGENDDTERRKQARIWSGGKCLRDRPFYLILNSDQQYFRVAINVAARINDTFQGHYHGGASHGLAEAKSKNLIHLNVPPQYKHNLPRFLRVVKFIPLQPVSGTNHPYRRKLEEQLLDPKTTVTAALRLEALGQDSIPVLKYGLEKLVSDDGSEQDSPLLVRFTSAEALAYLGNSTCGEELSRLIEQQRVLRAFCLTAMASLDEPVSHIKLGELLASNSMETRYGAFRALRALDDRDLRVRGELLNDSFWLHSVAPESSPLVHVSTSRRAEIVMFGQPAFLVPPFSFLAGPEFTVTASAGDKNCTIARFSLRYGTKRRQCSLKLEDVVRNLADLGANYPDVVELLCQADRCKCLDTPVAKDALPQAVSVYDLARAGEGDARLENTELEVLFQKENISPTPTLFETDAGRKSRPSQKRDEDALLRNRKTVEDRSEASRP